MGWACFSAIFTKGDSFLWLVFASDGNEILSVRDLLLKKKICS